MSTRGHSPIITFIFGRGLLVYSCFVCKILFSFAFFGGKENKTKLNECSNGKFTSASQFVKSLAHSRHKKKCSFVR